MRRTYRAIISINASDMITARTIADTINWHSWYIDTENKKNTFQQFETACDKKNTYFNYTLQNSDELRVGKIKLSTKNKWNTEIVWTEALEIHKGIFKKLHLLFNPSQYRAPFFQNLVQFKHHIEHPDSIFGGITFERIEIPSNKVVIKSDTVCINAMEEGILHLYNKIVAKIPRNMIKKAGTFLSQYEKISDSTAEISVAVEVNEPEKKLKIPFELTELETHQAVIMHTTKGYADIDSDVSIMYEWLKKNNERPATGFWIRHNAANDVAVASANNTLTIIQEIYSLQ